MEIQYLKGVGPAVAQKLQKIYIFTSTDAIYYFPTGYQDRRKITKIKDLKPEEEFFIVGDVQNVEESKKGNFHITKALVADNTSRINCIWFNQPFVKKKIEGNKIFIVGKYEFDFLSRSKIFKVTDYELVDGTNINCIMPIYALTKGIYQKQLRNIIKRSLEIEIKNLNDHLPRSIREKYQLPELSKSILNFHYPEDGKAYLLARKRLVFEDFLYLQLALALSRKLVRKKEKGISFKFKNDLSNSYFSSLPYTLTNAQQRVINEIRADMQSSSPMNRIVQGDVGSGKTEVAVAAILVALENKYQAAIMAPTEILAYQHYQKMLKYLVPLGIRVELLVGSLNKKDKTYKQALASGGSAQVVVGTHALIQEKVSFLNLGLAVIDEQHRFGVTQRASLMKKSGEIIDLLVVTATPIPRTLTLTLFGDLDKSILDEMPPGRTPIKTQWLRRIDSPTINLIKEQVECGNRVYWVFPLVEESEKLDLKAATEGKEYLQNQVFPTYKIGLMHGKMKQKEKDEVMFKFRTGEISILVSTTVIEVGVDVADATIMVIEHADRFGLSQLHQLRGRIGRSNKKSTCILLSATTSQNARKKLKAMVELTDGFKLAEIDLELRGPGDYFGSKQSGMPTMLVANLIKDEKLLLEAKKMATEIAMDIKDPIYRPVWEKLKSMPHLYVGMDGMN